MVTNYRTIYRNIIVTLEQARRGLHHFMRK